MLKRLAAFVASLMFVLLPLAMPTGAVLAQSPSGQAGGGFGLDQTVKTINDGQQTKVYQTGDPSILIGIIIKDVLQFVGVVFFLLIIYAGFLWMTAQGDEKKVIAAKAIIRNCVIGIVVIGSAYAITSFVLTGLQPPATTGGTTGP
jgi:hypothetical protein